MESGLSMRERSRVLGIAKTSVNSVVMKARAACIDCARVPF